MAGINLAEVTKTYDNGLTALEALSLDVRDGEALVLVGPSGCGKSTALQLIAGLESLSSGTIRIGERIVNEIPAKDRDIAMVFQSYALYPHMTVAENMAFSLKLRGFSATDVRQRVKSAANILGLEEMLDRKPKQLSGGQRQRVAMGRAIVREPQAFLMDEPLSNLDAKLRVHMRAEITRLRQRLGATTIYVTHDQVEAMTIGDRAAVMQRGKLQQIDEPHQLYEHPTNLFVAGFIGSPGMNIIQARLYQNEGVLFVKFGPHSLRLSEEILRRRPGLAAYVGRDVALGVRPEYIQDAALIPEAKADTYITATLELREELGAQVLTYFTLDAPSVLNQHTRDLALDLGAQAVQDLERRAESGKCQFVAQLDQSCRAKAGDSVRLAVDTTKLYFFEIDSGVAIA